MASRFFKPVQALNPEIKIIAGSFSIASSGGAATLVSGLGYTVAKSSTANIPLRSQTSTPPAFPQSLRFKQQPPLTL